MSNDFLWGAEAISEVIGLDYRATYHLLSSGHLPAKKVGGKWVASRERLVAFLVSDEPPRSSAGAERPDPGTALLKYMKDFGAP